MLGEGEADSRADGDGNSGIDQAFAQVNQMIEKRHTGAGLFGGSGQNGGIKLGGIGHRSLFRARSQAVRPREAAEFQIRVVAATETMLRRMRRRWDDRIARFQAEVSNPWRGRRSRCWFR